MIPQLGEFSSRALRAPQKALGPRGSVEFSPNSGPNTPGERSLFFIRRLVGNMLILQPPVHRLALNKHFLNSAGDAGF